jgi:hypothetical protein
VELTNGNRISGRVGEVMADAFVVVSATETLRRSVVPISAAVAVSGPLIDVE